MKIPWWLYIIIVFLIVVGIVGFIINFSMEHLLGNLGNLALILTLAAMLAYVHYTRELARISWEPSASYVLVPFDQKPPRLRFIIRNHSKVSLQCWCKIQATVYGQAVSLSGFYSGEHSCDLQPFGEEQGNFTIEKEILSKVNRVWTDMEAEARAGSSNSREQLYLTVDFWYTTTDKKIRINNPRKSYYFDFVLNVLILDV